MVKILYVCPDFVIASKPHGLPTVPLKSQNAECTLLGEVSLQYPDVSEVCGKNPWEGGALHRLDTATAGLVVFARNQDFYEKLSEFQGKDLFFKTYSAKCGGDFSSLPPEISTYFRYFGPHRAMVKPVPDIEKSENRRLYTTWLSVNSSEVLCTITRGFKHQIRSHLAYLNCPIRGDELYSTVKEEIPLQLECIGVHWPGFTYGSVVMPSV